ncbi:MAG TPA: hypothetical protein VGG28_30610 [Kofleriaceae bacterium]|jgi:hypothetical protein
MRFALVLLVATACGPQSGATGPSPINPIPPTEHTVDPPAMCKRMRALHDQHCGMFEDIGLGATCEQEVSGSLADSQSRLLTMQMDTCLDELTICSDITACIGNASTSVETRDCSDHSERAAGNPVGVPYATWRSIMKRGYTKFSQVVSSKPAPIELCGVSTENYWLSTLLCDDGSRPLANRSAAERARLGNIGNGGRCGSIVDHYRVACPEKPYDVFMDGAVCPQVQQ